MSAPVWLRTPDATASRGPDHVPSQAHGAGSAVDPEAHLTVQALTDVLARAQADDLDRRPATPLSWQVLCLRTDGAAGLFDLTGRPRRPRWLRGGHGGVRLVARPPRTGGTTLTLPEGLDGYAAVVVVEHAGGSGSRRLQEAGQACWRAATAAGFDAALITASPRIDGEGPRAWRDPVVAVGIARLAAPGADHAFRMGDR